MDSYPINIKNLQAKTKEELIQEVLELRESKLNFGDLPIVDSYQSEEFYELLFQSTHYGIAVTDDEYKIDFVNNRFYQIFEVEYSNLEDLTLPESFIKFSKRNQYATIVKKLDFFKDFTLDLGNNKIKELRVRCIHFRDKDKKLKLIFQIKDITEYKLSKKEVIASEKRFRAIVESSHNSIIIINENRRIEYVNKQTLKLYSLHEDELLGKDFTLFIDKDSLAKVQEIFEQIVQNKTVLSEYELKLKLADGKKIIAKISTSNLKLNRKDKIIVQIDDITEDARKKQLQLVLLNILQAVNVIKNLPEFFGIIRKELSNVMDTKNFYIALYNYKNKIYHFPYYVDETDENYESSELKYSLTDYIRRKNKALLVNDKVRLILANQGEIKDSATGVYAPIWMGAPLFVEDKVVGVIALQNYHYENTYDHNDLELLKLIAQNVSTAIWRKQIIDKLIESQLRYRDFISRSSEAIYRMDFVEPINTSLPITEQVKLILEHASIRECNYAFALMYGFNTSEELVGKKILDFSGSEQYEENFDLYYNFVKNSYQMTDLETVQLNKKGEKIIISNNAVGIIKYGFLHNIWGIEKDITEIKRNQEVIKELAEGISSLTGGSFFKSLVQFLCKKLKIDYAVISEIRKNYEKADILSLCGKGGLLDVFSFELAKTPCNVILNKGHFLILDNIQKKYPDNKFFTAHKINYYLGLPLVDSNRKVIGFITLFNKNEFEDIEFTRSVLEIFASRSAAEIERKRYLSEVIIAKEEAEKSNKLKSDFLAQMSHEIRTPVNTILSFASLLKENIQDRVDDELKDSFKIIENGGRRLIRTIDLILDVSQIQAGNLKITLDTINLIKILEDLMPEFEQEAAKKDLSLTFDTELEELNVIADLYTVTQIFVNLIHNAIKYTFKGGITLSAYKSEHGEVYVKIVDTGVGMSEEFLTKIFEPFSQEETGYTRKFEGTGLGLTLVRNYCELNKAKISIESKKNKGSTFIVKFTHDDSQLSFF
ncbi:MAG: hypothetical protein CR986_08315 [Ignavibacteriae bacterium]|nr:MAG: hypothetical protein CR986_08315 [Ignavibacteriota bacterium]